MGRSLEGQDLWQEHSGQCNCLSCTLTIRSHTVKTMSVDVHFGTLRYSLITLPKWQIKTKVDMQCLKAVRFTLLITNHSRDTDAIGRQLHGECSTMLRPTNVTRVMLHFMVPYLGIKLPPRLFPRVSLIRTLDERYEGSCSKKLA